MSFSLDARIPLGFQGFDPAVGQRNALLRLQQQAAEADLDERNALNAALQRAGAGLSADDPAKRAAAAAEIGQVGPRGYALAAPILAGVRNERAVANIFGGGAPAAPASPVPSAPPAGGDMLTRIAAVESGGNDAARNPRSSAAGRFQIIDSTWNQYAPRLGLRPDQRMDPAAQEQVARAIQRDATIAVGRDLTPGEQYGAHLLGVGGLRAFLGADPNADAQTVYAQAAGPGIAAQAFQRNPGLLEPGLTVGQVLQRISARVGGDGDAQASAPRRAPMPGQPTPAQFAQLTQAAAGGNEVAQRLVQMWAPFMRQGEATLPPTISLGAGPHGPEGIYERTPQGLRYVGPRPEQAPPVQVNMPAGDTVRGRADAAVLPEVQRSANDSRQLLALFDRAEQAVRRTPEGQGAQLLPVIGQAARALGIEIAGTSEAEVLRSITNGMAVLQRAPGSGATTDFEMRLYMQAVPRLGNTREGNLRLIDIGRRLAQRRIEEANIWRRHAGEPDLMERLQALPPVFTDEDRLFLQDASPANDEMPTAAPQPPGAAARPRPRARNAQGQVIEWDGSAWVPAR